jgi:hypothetical protein
MGNNTASTLAFAALVPTWAAIADLKVNERTGTEQSDIRGQVCPATGGGTDFGAQTRPSGNQSVTSLTIGSQQFSTIGSQQFSSDQPVSLTARNLSARTRLARYGSAISTLSSMDNVQLSKPRTGYHATSGTG